MEANKNKIKKCYLDNKYDNINILDLVLINNLIKINIIILRHDI
jgi:hypothetical protein